VKVKTATHCNTLQHTCNTLQHSETLQNSITLCNNFATLLQKISALCNTHKYEASVSQNEGATLLNEGKDCNTLQHTATLYRTLLHYATTLQHSATLCNTHKYGASVSLDAGVTLQNEGNDRNTVLNTMLQRTATQCCNALQHTATLCNILKHPKTLCNTIRSIYMLLNESMGWLRLVGSLKL